MRRCTVFRLMSVATINKRDVICNPHKKSSKVVKVLLQFFFFGGGGGVIMK